MEEKKIRKKLVSCFTQVFMMAINTYLFLFTKEKEEDSILFSRIKSKKCGVEIRCPICSPGENTSLSIFAS